MPLIAVFPKLCQPGKFPQSFLVFHNLDIFKECRSPPHPTFQKASLGMGGVLFPCCVSQMRQDVTSGGSRIHLVPTGGVDSEPGGVGFFYLVLATS
jgi:hypothetical protein